MKPFLPLAALVFASPIFAQTTWTVSSTDPGADFATIQSAVNAAADGDTVLVRSGSYAGFAIDGKALNVVGDSGGEVIVNFPFLSQYIRIVNLPAGSSVTLRGVQVHAFANPSTKIGLYLRDNLGDVWVEDFEHDSDFGTFSSVGFSHALRVRDCVSVALVNCRFLGRAGSQGLVASDSNIFAYGSEFRGGDGGTEIITGNTSDGGNGANLLSGELFAADSTFRGGDGLDGNFLCEPPTNGGLGAQLSGGVFRDRTNAFGGGIGGTGGVSACGAADGLSGVGLVANGGSLQQFSVAARGVTANSPVFEGQPSTQTYFGLPGEAVFSTIGFSLESGTFLSPFIGPNLVGSPSIFRFCGILNASGTRTKSFTVQELGIDAVTAYFQPVFFDFNSSTFRLGAPSSVTLLDGGFQTP